MPNSASAKKDLRQNHARRSRNRALRSAMRSQVNRVRTAVQDGDFERAEAEFRIAAKKLDQAGSKHLIHKNAASRSKSRLAHLIKTAKAAS